MLLAEADFNKADCASGGFAQDGYTFAPSTDGAWSCARFDLDAGGVNVMKIQVPLAMEGAEMQVRGCEPPMPPRLRNAPPPPSSGDHVE